MKRLDTILELLRDSQWHGIEEIRKEISLPPDKLNEALRFLEEQGFIEIKNGELRITSRGLKFLELPT